MKKIIFALLAAVAPLGVSAQSDLFHFGIGLNAGTNGAGLDASIGLTRFIQVRGGFSYVPKKDFNYDASIYNEANRFISVLNYAGQTHIAPLPEKTQMKICPNAMTYHALLDFYPVGGFHITVGAYFGEENVIRMHNDDGSLKPMAVANSLIEGYNALNPQTPIPPVGVQIGEYLFTPDANGNMDAEAHVQKMRPYVGIGFGRAVPRHHRVGCSLDIGAQYWKKPSYTCNGHEVQAGEYVRSSNDLANKASNLPIYPVVTLRLCGRIL